MVREAGFNPGTGSAMKDSEYYELLGRLVGNFCSLEVAVRMFLHGYNREATMPDLPDLNVGTEVAESSFTNWDSLGDLVDKFNKVVQDRDLDDKLDRCVVRVRDMIAHGRILGVTPAPPHTLYKFGRPQNGRVTVEAVEMLDESFLHQQLGRVFQQVRIVVRASKALGQDTFSP